MAIHSPLDLKLIFKISSFRPFGVPLLSTATALAVVVEFAEHISCVKTVIAQAIL
jgi:hypothetical protein